MSACAESSHSHSRLLSDSLLHESYLGQESGAALCSPLESVWASTSICKSGSVRACSRWKLSLAPGTCKIILIPSKGNIPRVQSFFLDCSQIHQPCVKAQGLVASVQIFPERKWHAFGDGTELKSPSGFILYVSDWVVYELVWFLRRAWYYFNDEKMGWGVSEMRLETPWDEVGCQLRYKRGYKQDFTRVACIITQSLFSGSPHPQRVTSTRRWGTLWLGTSLRRGSHFLEIEPEFLCSVNAAQSFPQGEVL